MATRSGVRAPHRSGPARSPYSGNKMLTAMPGGVPVAVRTARPAKGRTVTLSRDEYRYQPVPQPDRFEIEAAKRYRQRVAKRLARSVGWTEPPPQPKTRMGIGIAAGLRMRRAVEQHAFAVGRLLGLR